ncbi:MAG: precorrin-3B synthase [Rhodospirillales bacterium]|nr:precorrin-3B synthase [Rhodospirillales bacterium]
MPERSVTFDIAEARRGLRASVCPGLFRMVPARDGGICRVKIPLGELSAAKARAIAAAATRFGNGIIEATNRANLQLRGIRPADETALIESLLDADFGPTRPDADDIRNVMINPTAGIDLGQDMDARPLARALLAHLEASSACRALSAKFSILVDGGEDVAVVDHPHDIWLASLDGGSRLALGLAGSPPVRADDPTPFMAVRAEHAVEAVVALVALFVDEAAGDTTISRFRHVLARPSRDDIFDRLSRRVGRALERGATVEAWRRRSPVRLGHVGVRPQRQTGVSFVGAVPPLGRVTPDGLARLASVAEERGDGTLRLTPWQSIIVPTVATPNAQAVMETLESFGLACRASQPLATMVACSGSPGCASGHADTKSDAVTLARTLGAAGEPAPRIHLSGCVKSCASIRVADITLVAVAPGLYDLFVKDSAAPDKFGHAVARHITVDDAGVRIRAILAARSSVEPEGSA